MKILAIRGQNLASLADPFEIRLDRPPLDAAGLFAIVGPTGSGKSTILDALCLALYGRTPRLSNRGGTDIRPDESPDGDSIKSNDSRTILRHGAAEGFAEVDFHGADQKAYRARWAVRRARNSPRGRLQNEERSLVRLETNEPVAAGKVREMGEEITRLIGLDYDQFTRSVLLAQGDFARFLRAEEEERATLLETLTGTQLYGEISQLAFQRSKDEDGKLAQLQSQIEVLARLSAEEREALERERASREQEKQSLEIRRGGIEAAVAWHADLGRLRADEAKAASDAQDAADAVTAAGGRRAELETVRDVQELRPLLDTRDQRARELADAAAKVHAEAAAAAQLEREAGDATRGATEADGVHLAAADAVTALAPKLEKARGLDIRIVTAERDAAGARQDSEKAGRKRDASAKASDLAAREVAGLDERVQAATGWFAAHAQIEPLARSWEARKRDLTEYAEKAADLQDAGTQAATADETLEQSESLLRTAQQDREAARQGLEHSRQALEAAESHLAEIPAELLRADLKTWTRIREWGQALQAIVRDVEAASVAAAGAQAEAEEATAACTRDRQRHAEGEKKLAALRDDRAAHESSVRLAEAARGLDEQRADLVEGTPCPLCGSTSHPWSAPGSLPAGDAVRLRKRLEKLLTDERRLADEVARLAESIQSGTETARKATDRAGKERSRLSTAIESWRSERARVRQPADVVATIPRDPTEEGTGAVVAAVLADAGARLERANQAEDERSARLEARDAAREAESARQKAFLEADRAVNDLDRQVQAERAARDAARKEKARLERETKRLLTTLDPALRPVPAWKDDLRASPGAFLAARSADVEAWAGTQREVDEANGRLQKLRPQAAALAAEARNDTQAATKAREILDAREAALEELRTERAAFFDGRPAAEVQAEAERLREEAGKVREAARARLDDLRQRLAGTQRALETLEDQRAARARSLDEAEARLGERLAARQIDLDRLRALLSFDATWIREQAGELEALDRAAGQTATVLQERIRKREEKEASAAPEWSREQAEESLPSVRDQLKTADEALANVRGQLARDDHAHARARDLECHVREQRERAGLWRSLRDLIGSADGKKLRVFAQSLSLDILLAEANEFLHELAPRYRVQRVPRSDMDLMVVDLDMANEVRTVNSLSGGEGFLVSLALALGLSALSSRRTHVGSLFIDEGFGTLDPRSLEMALSVLDSLQATGRQIAVISHVAGMAEGIGHRVRVRPRGPGRSVVEVSAG